MNGCDEASAVEEIKEQFNSTIKEDSPSLIPGEATKFLRNDALLLRFYRHQKGDVKNAAKMLERFLKWRKTFGLDTLKEKDISKSLLKRGAIHLKGYSRGGQQILWAHIKNIKKGTDLESGKKLFVLLFEKILWDQNTCSKICFVIDMLDAGFSNLDMDLMRFVVTMLQNFYPELPEVIIPYSMPFLFKAAWNVIKGWLDADSLALIKFCGHKEVVAYIDPAQLPESMHGSNAFLYDYDQIGLDNPDKNEPSNEHSSNSVNSSVSDKIKHFDGWARRESSESQGVSKRQSLNAANTDSEDIEDVFGANKSKDSSGVPICRSGDSFIILDKNGETIEVKREEQIVAKPQEVKIEDGDTRRANFPKPQPRERSGSVAEGIRAIVGPSGATYHETQRGMLENMDVCMGNYISAVPSVIDLNFLKTNELIIKNQHSNKVAFKLRLTHPQFLKLRPVSGVLHSPDAFCNIKIFQQSKNGSAPDVVKVQIIACPLTEQKDEELFVKDQTEFWRDLNTKYTDKLIVYIKLRSADKVFSGDEQVPSATSAVQFELETIGQLLTGLSNQTENLVENSKRINENLLLLHKCVIIVLCFLTFVLFLRICHFI